jgi:hypothetical protein
MTEPQASSRRSRQSRQSRQSAAPAPHNTEEVEFSANQPLNSLRAVRSIPVNPCLQMHSKSLYIYSLPTGIRPPLFLKPLV